jgi:pyruvate/2-oxoglutarate dehydrogenase complex dihydrolipoamide dehydrogenase (E3) component
VSDEYDVVVIGAGPPGENVADRAVKGGLTAVIVESELVGGECSYWACMPSKALLRPVTAVAEADQLKGVTGAQLDPPSVLARRDVFTSGWKDDGQVDWLNGAHIDLVRGHARLAGPRNVSVGPAPAAAFPAGTVSGMPAAGTRELRARHAVVIANGSQAAIPPVRGLADVRPWTSREATSAHEIPSRLAIIGGGVVGCEMAAAWQAFGAQVTLLVRDRLLERVEDFAGELVAEGLSAAGVNVRRGISVTAAERPSLGGPVSLLLDDQTRLEADEVLVATGRAPRTRDLGLETVGLAPGSWLDVDGTCQVTGIDGGWLYGVGDVNHLALLTHMGKYQARICGDAIAARAKGAEPAATAWADQSAVPQVIFTMPEVAAVGLSSAQAREAGRNIRVVDYDLGAVSGAKLFADSYAGHARMVVDEDSKTMIGATLAGPGVGELIHAATVAVAGQVPLDRLWHAVPSYPTISEIWLRLLEAYGL